MVVLNAVRVWHTQLRCVRAFTRELYPVKGRVNKCCPNHSALGLTVSIATGQVYVRTGAKPSGSVERTLPGSDGEMSGKTNSTPVGLGGTDSSVYRYFFNIGSVDSFERSMEDAQVSAVLAPVVGDVCGSKQCKRSHSIPQHIFTAFYSAMWSPALCYSAVLHLSGQC